MSIDVKVYDNGDHTCLVWLTSDKKPIPKCRGFTMRRLLAGTETYLHGFVGFSDGDKLDPAAPWKHPVQRFLWWDYGVKPGDVVQYSIVPVIGTDKDHLQLGLDQASALTQPMTISGQVSPHVGAYFNKGIVAAQWVAHALAAVGKNAKLPDLIKQKDNPLRNALSGLLRPQILSLLAEAKQTGGDVYAALYELNDPELIDALTAIGPEKCHLLLANGAFKKPDNDENKAVRAALQGKVDLSNRIVSGNHFAHNKFVVFCDPAGTPQRVLTGSTNWTVTGLCTQANNGIIVDDPNVAADFLEQWKLLKAAGNGYPATLATNNSKSNTFDVDGGKITQWFAPTDGGPDLAYARKLIEGAKDAILFLFFNPGHFVAANQPTKWTLLQNILTRHHTDSPNFDPNLYLRGVVNQSIENLTDLADSGQPVQASVDPTSPPPVSLFKDGKTPPLRLRYDAMVPKNIKEAFHDWMAEALGAGVHIHSKVVVIDPFGDKPVVMTGSHNLGYKASTANDDNLMIVEGNAALAVAYAVNIIAIYQTYRWNAYVEQHRQDPKVWHGLEDNDIWQTGHLSGDHLAETQFWLGLHRGTAAAPGPAATPVRTATASGPAPDLPDGALTRARPARKAAAKRIATKKRAVKKSAVKKRAVRKTAVKKRAVKKSAAKKRAATKTTRPRKAATKKAAAKKSRPRKSVAKKRAPVRKRAAVKKPARKRRPPA